MPKGFYSLIHFPSPMPRKELEHGPFRIYMDDSGNLWVYDSDVGLCFERGKISEDRWYDLAVIIEEDNGEYWGMRQIFSPEQPCGFHILDEMTLGQWNNNAEQLLISLSNYYGLRYSRFLAVEIREGIGSRATEVWSGLRSIIGLNNNCLTYIYGLIRKWLK